MQALALAALVFLAACAAPPAAADCRNEIQDMDGDRACTSYDEPSGYAEALCDSGDGGGLEGCPEGIDRDHDRFPTVAEPFLCVVEDGGTPGDGTCNDGDYRVPE